MLLVFADSSVRNQSVCGSSKVSLKGVGVLTPHSCSNSRERKKKGGFGYFSFGWIGNGSEWVCVS
jgi:hypothetical protein